MTDTCQVSRCRQPSTLQYGARQGKDPFGVCLHHWTNHCANTPFDLRTCTLKKDPHQ